MNAQNFAIRLAVFGLSLSCTGSVFAQAPTGSVTYQPAVQAQGGVSAAQAIPTSGSIALILLGLLLAVLAVRALRSKDRLRRVLSVAAFSALAALSLAYGLQSKQVQAIISNVEISGAECTTETVESYDPTATGIQLSSNCTEAIEVGTIDVTGCSVAAATPATCVEGQVLGTGAACELHTCSETGPQVAGACQGGATKLSTSPGGDMVVCDDPTDTVCEQDVETLCPTGMQLCTQPQLNARNDGWAFAITSNVVVGEIHCRTNSGAGHFTMNGTNSFTSLSNDNPQNCHFGSSRPSCTTTFGCNEQEVSALCCLPTPTCGNGVVDSPEEQCDDGNNDETDACLNSCSFRTPGSGLGC